MRKTLPFDSYRKKRPFASKTTGEQARFHATINAPPADFSLYIRRQNKALLRSMRNHGHDVRMHGPLMLSQRLYCCGCKR